jgi:adenylylsulfate kinase
MSRSHQLCKQHITMGKDSTSLSQLQNPFVSRPQKEALLRQKGKVIWMTGLSGAGKTTLAVAIEKALVCRGFLTQVFDADIIRATINRDLDFSLEGRLQNIYRMAYLSRFFLDSGFVVINCFISPTHHIRYLAKKIIGEADYIEVFVNASLEVCEQRDPKGLYRNVRENKLKDFTGFDSPYEPPRNPDIELNTEEQSVDNLVKTFIDFITPKISI